MTPTDQHYGVYQGNRLEIFQLLPILIVLAFIPLILPLLTQLFAGLFTPMNFTHGKRKREAFGPFGQKDFYLEQFAELINSIEKSIEKYKS